MRLAAVLMQKDEVGLLEQWLTYYAELCEGYENLYIFDDSSTEPSVLAALAEAEEKGAHVRYNTTSHYNLPQRGVLTSELIRTFGDRYDCYIPADCDEFISVETPRGPVISRSAVIAAIDDAIREFDRPLIRLDGSFQNIPATTRVRWRRFKKVIVRSLPPGIELDFGCHLFKPKANRDSVDPQIIAPSNLVYLHCHNKPYGLLQKCARDKLKPFLRDLSRDSLLAYQGKAFHVAKYLLQTKEEYLASFASQSTITPNIAVQELLGRINAGWSRYS